jgi:hypothetical protein
MYWKYLMYGSGTPSRARRLTTNTIVSVVLAAIYGLWTDFVPTRLTQIAGTSLAVAATATITWTLVRGYLTGRIPFGPTATTRVRRASVLCAIAPVVFIFSWIVLVRSIPDLLIRWIAQPTSLVVELHKVRGLSRRACDYQVRGEYLGIMPGHICVQPQTFEKLPEAGLMTLRVRTSTIGTHIIAVEPAPDNMSSIPYKSQTR